MISNEEQKHKQHQRNTKSWEHLSQQKLVTILITDWDSTTFNSEHIGKHNFGISIWKT